MLTHLKKILSGKKKQTSQQSQGHNTLQNRLASAIILLEAAHIDDECSQEEKDHIAATIRSGLDISDDYASELMILAHDTRKHEVDLWQFTNRINNEFSHEEKLDIIENVWEIIYLDGYLDKHEDHFAHKLANLLRLTHEELIDAKMKVKKKK